MSFFFLYFLGVGTNETWYYPFDKLDDGGTSITSTGANTGQKKATVRKGASLGPFNRPSPFYCVPCLGNHYIATESCTSDTAALNVRAGNEIAFGCYLNPNFGYLNFVVGCNNNGATAKVEVLESKVKDVAGSGAIDFFCGACGGAIGHLMLRDCDAKVVYLNSYTTSTVPPTVGGTKALQFDGPGLE